MNQRDPQLGDDLRLTFDGDGGADIAWSDHDGGPIRGRDNLVQALTLRLLIQRGELTALAHPRFGCRVHELIGAPMSRANLDLLRRHVRRALLADPRVEAIETLTIHPIATHPGGVQIGASVRARGGAVTDLDLALDLS